MPHFCLDKYDKVSANFQAFFMFRMFPFSMPDICSWKKVNVAWNGLKSTFCFWQLCNSELLPSRQLHTQKLTIEALEQGGKYVQS